MFVCFLIFSSFYRLEQNSIVEGPDFTNLKKQSPPTFLECDEDLKKVTAFSQLLHSYNSMKSYEPKSDQEEHIKRVYLDM
jgi:hypothetical protein